MTVKMEVADALRPARLEPKGEERRKAMGRLAGMNVLVHGPSRTSSIGGSECPPYYVCEFADGAVRYIRADDLRFLDSQGMFAQFIWPEEMVK